MNERRLLFLSGTHLTIMAVTLVKKNLADSNGLPVKDLHGSSNGCGNSAKAGAY